MQAPSANDIVQIATNQNYGAAGVLLLVCIWLAWSKHTSEKQMRKDLADKDAQIMQVIDDHKTDLKEANSDYKVMLEKYNSFVAQLKLIVNGRSGLQ